MKIFVIDYAANEASEEFSERFFSSIVTDDHLDDQRTAGHDVVQLVHLVRHLLLQRSLIFRKMQLNLVEILTKNNLLSEKE